MAAKKFTVFALLYGQYPELASRCLSSIVRVFDSTMIGGIRVGMNHAVNTTKDIARKYLKQIALDYPEVTCCLYDAGDSNQLKYPMMRKMFYDLRYPIDTDYTMWFDDDSCVARTASSKWWRRVNDVMESADMVGSLWRQQLTARQQAAICEQSWYCGIPVRPFANFVTGGWWCARTVILRTWDYPWPDLRHNGGDVMLGELMRQRSHRISNFTGDVWINADSTGKCSTAARRGQHSTPLWADYIAGQRPNLEHHDFEVVVTKF